MCPGASPDLTDSRIPLPHFRTLKSIQSTLRSFGIYRLIDGLEFLADSRTVFVGNECSGRSNQMHNAGLMKRLRVDRFDGLRHALQAICNGDEDVFYASSLEAVEYGRPEACSFVLSDPHAQNLARAIGSDTDPQMHRHVLDGGSAADLDAKSIEECYGIQAIQRSVLPLLDILQDPVRNSADVVRADADAVG